MRNVQIFDEYYVGIQNESKLGFATPIKPLDLKGTEKRKSTVNSWARGGTFMTINNAPRVGFKIGKSVQRYSTQNKLFRVFDPYGFELEISTNNLETLISECLIDHGEIKHELLWGRDGNNNVLITTNHKAYLEHLNPPEPIAYVESADIKPGDYVRIGEKQYQYVGLKRAQTISVDRYRAYGNRFPYKYTAKQHLDSKPWHVYREIVDEKYLKSPHNEKYWRTRHGRIEIRRSKMKNSIKTGAPMTPLPKMKNDWQGFSSHSCHHQLIKFFDSAKEASNDFNTNKLSNDEMLEITGFDEKGTNFGVW